MTERTVPDDAALMAIPSAEISHGDTVIVESTGHTYTYDETFLLRSEEEGSDVVIGADGAADDPFRFVLQSRSEEGEGLDVFVAPEAVEKRHVIFQSPSSGADERSAARKTGRAPAPRPALPLDQAREEARVAASLKEQRHLGDAALQFAIAWSSENGFAISTFTRQLTKIVMSFGPAKGRRLPDPLSQYVFSQQVNSGVYLIDLRQWKRNLTSLPLLIPVPIENDPLDAYASHIPSVAHWAAHWAKLREKGIIA